MIITLPDELARTWHEPRPVYESKWRAVQNPRRRWFTPWRPKIVWERYNGDLIAVETPQESLIRSLNTPNPLWPGPSA